MILNFLRRLFSVKGEQVTKRRAGFLVLDVDQEAARMGLKSKGAADGARDMPATTASALGTAEEEVIRRGREVLRENSQIYESDHKTLSGRLSELTPEGMRNTVELRVDSWLQDLGALPNKHKEELRTRAATVFSTARELKLFKSDNGLDSREASYPNSKLLVGAVLFAIAVAESILNASLLAQGNQLGLLGGWVEAVLISLINAVFLAAFSATLFRRTVHVSGAKRWSARLGLLILTIAAVMFNLVLAHYRNALAGDTPESAASLSWISFTSDPFALGDVRSLMLFLIGVSVWLFSTYEWLKMDDLYPNYGAISRRHRDAIQEFGGYKQWLIHEQLENLKNQINEVLIEFTEKAANAESTDAEIRRSIDALNKRYIETQNGVIESINYMLKIYRESNETRRESAPPPHFAVDWKPAMQIDVEPVPEKREFPTTDIYKSSLAPVRARLDEIYGQSLHELNEFVS